MNICFYTFAFLPTTGGAEILLHNLANSLTDRGHSCTVWAPNPKIQLEDIGNKYRLKFYRKPFSKRFLARLPGVKVIMDNRKMEFDILHCHGGYPESYVGKWISKMTGIPYVVRPHGSDVIPGEWIRKKRCLEKRMEKSLQSAEAVIAQGKSFIPDLTDLGVDQENITIIHNGVASAPDSYSEVSTQPYFFSMGSLADKKGYDILIRAYASIFKDNPEIKLKIAGTGNGRYRLRQDAIELTGGENVDFIGNVTGDEKHRLLSGALGYICSSRREPFSNALLEALAAGKPVIATAVGGNTEIIVDEESGILVPPEDIDSLAAAMKRIIGDPELQKKLAGGAKQRSLDFEWEFMVDRYETLYKEVAGINV